jgi:hypothetical protein
MNLDEFEVRYREQIKEILNRLQSAVAVSSQLELIVADVGDAVQGLSRDVEQFLVEQRASAEEDRRP